MSPSVAIQDPEFDLLLNYNGPVAIDCFAPWCGPCKVISPFIDQLAEEYKGRAKVVKLDIEKNKTFVKKFGLQSIPAVLIFKGGNLVETLVGVAPYERFSQALEQYL